MPKYKRLQNRFSIYGSLRHRELGQKTFLGFEDKFSKKLLSSILPCSSWDHLEDCRNRDHGGVFNLEFSQDGSLLVAACEKKSILMFDPLCRRLIHSIDNAHRDCVNCVRFLDSRVFATCSDDSTVALWDARNLKNRIRTLHGHSNWVKNIEFSSREDLLVTSGFDGSIYTWDINSYTEKGFLYNRVFHTNGLMRTRLNPDASKMIICTTSGYLIIIHDLDLHNLPIDLYGFKPNMYRLMQLSRATIPMAVRYNHLFSRWRRRNRVEFVSDFPVGDEAEVVSSLQVHPQGWAVLSRNISNDESSEWSCVHDIQEREMSGDDEDAEHVLATPREIYIAGEDIQSRENGEDLSSLIARSINAASSSSSSDNQNASAPPDSSSSSASDAPCLSNRSVRREGSGSRSARAESHSSSSNQYRPSTVVWEAILAIRDARMLREGRGRGNMDVGWTLSGRNVGSVELGLMGRSGRGPAPERVVLQAYSSADGLGINLRENAAVARSDASRGGRSQVDRSESNDEYVEDVDAVGCLEPQNVINTKIHKNVPRLTHFCEEPNVGRGFIKELCFGAGGRLICSPFGFGVRLLAFSPECSELSAVVPQKPPIMLYEIATNICHTDIVVSTKFSPTQCLLVSGCLKGKVVWHQPIL